MRASHNDGQTSPHIGCREHNVSTLPVFPVGTCDKQGHLSETTDCQKDILSIRPHRNRHRWSRGSSVEPDTTTSTPEHSILARSTMEYEGEMKAESCYCKKTGTLDRAFQPHKLAEMADAVRYKAVQRPNQERGGHDSLRAWHIFRMQSH